MGDPAARSCLERQMAGYLTAMGIPFSEQHSNRLGFVIDFLLKLPRADGTTTPLDLEVDGSNWHSSPAQRRRDAFRDHRMRAAGYAVLRVREPFTAHFVEGEIREVARRHGCLWPGSSGE
jgi:very-short-patch-repair endonuclease